MGARPQTPMLDSSSRKRGPVAKSVEPSRSGFNMNVELVSFELGFPGSA